MFEKQFATKVNETTMQTPVNIHALPKIAGASASNGGMRMSRAIGVGNMQSRYLSKAGGQRRLNFAVNQRNHLRVSKNKIALYRPLPAMQE